MRVLGYKGRSNQKGFFIFLKKTNNRNSQISSFLLGKSILIKNGFSEKRFVFKKRNLKTKLGQYFLTKRIGFNIHMIKAKKKKYKKKIKWDIQLIYQD